MYAVVFFLACKLLAGLNSMSKDIFVASFQIFSDNSPSKVTSFSFILVGL